MMKSFNGTLALKMIEGIVINDIAVPVLSSVCARWVPIRASATWQCEQERCVGM